MNRIEINKKITKSPLSRGRGAEPVPTLQEGEGEKGLPLHAGAEPHQFKYARELRREMTRAEKVLWEKLRARRFLNLKFRRQHPILEFIADFYCHELKLIVEADGKYHEENDAKYYDSERTKELIGYGYSVIRFSNEEIINEIDNVLRQLKEIVTRLIETSPQPLSLKERGFCGQVLNSTHKVNKDSNPSPSPRGEGRGEVKKKGTQP